MGVDSEVKRSALISLADQLAEQAKNLAEEEFEEEF